MIWTPSRKIITPRRFQKGNFAMFPAGTTAVAGAGGVTYTLQGTSGSPVVSSHATTSPADALAGWYFENTTFDVDKLNFASSRTYDHDWVDGTPPDIWIRATNHLGDDPNQGDSLATWLKLHGTGSAERSWRWSETTNGFASTAGTIHVELSTDSSGTTIVDEGYYRGVASVEL